MRSTLDFIYSELNPLWIKSTSKIIPVNLLQKIDGNHMCVKLNLPQIKSTSNYINFELNLLRTSTSEFTPKIYFKSNVLPSMLASH